VGGELLARSGAGHWQLGVQDCLLQGMRCDVAPLLLAVTCCPGFCGGIETCSTCSTCVGRMPSLLYLTAAGWSGWRGVAYTPAQLCCS
jgi:hypothetical protein